MTETSDLLKHLLSDHVGQNNAITQTKLAKKMDMNTSTLRSDLRRLREERNIPIGNLKDGYFLIQNEEELQNYIGHVNGEIASKKNTIEHTLEAYESFDGDVSAIEDTQEVVEDSYSCAKCGGNVPKGEAKYPSKGENPDKPHCDQCFGQILINA